MPSNASTVLADPAAPESAGPEMLPAQRPTRTKSRHSRHEARAGVALATPAVLGVLIFFVAPLIAAIAISFTDWGLLNAPEFLGGDNYARFFDDPKIAKSLTVTFSYALLSVPTAIIAALVLALLLNQRVRAHRLFVLLFYLPSIIPIVAVIMVFLWLLDPNLGIVNVALGSVGLPTPNWFNDPAFVLPSFVLMNLWGAGSGALIFLAARRGIPTSLYEAAMIDGAGPLTQFRYITLPMLTPVIMFTLIIGINGALQTFAEGFFLGGGKENSALFYNLYLYQNAFQNGEMGYASAMAIVLFVITLVITALTFRSSVLWVFYESNRK